MFVVLASGRRFIPQVTLKQNNVPQNACIIDTQTCLSFHNSVLGDSAPQHCHTKVGKLPKSLFTLDSGKPFVSFKKTDLPLA